MMEGKTEKQTGVANDLLVGRRVGGALNQLNKHNFVLPLGVAVEEALDGLKLEN